ncbi:hypothetical protein D3C76_1294760 [compost metagenome]
MIELQVSLVIDVLQLRIPSTQQGVALIEIVFNAAEIELVRFNCVMAMNNGTGIVEGQFFHACIVALAIAGDVASVQRHIRNFFGGQHCPFKCLG